MATLHEKWASLGWDIHATGTNDPAPTLLPDAPDPAPARPGSPLLARMLTDRLTVVRRTGTDDDRQRRYTWADVGDPLPTRIAPASMVENVGSQTGSPRDTVIDYWTAIIAGWPDIGPADRVRDDNGRVYEVDGHPQQDRNRRGTLQITTLRLRIATDI